MMRRPDKTGDTDIHTRQQLLGEEWWTSAFLALMRPGRDTIEFARGRKLAERGQVIIRGIVPGGVEAPFWQSVGHAGSPGFSGWTTTRTQPSDISSDRTSSPGYVVT